MIIQEVETMEKMKKTARILDGVFKVFFWVLVVYCAVFAVAGVAALIGGERLAQSEHVRMAVLSYSGLSFSGDIIPAMNFSKTFSLLSAFFVLSGALLLYCITVVRRILSPMKHGDPFHAAVSGCFRRLGWLSLIFGAMQVIMVNVARRVAAKLLLEAMRGTEIPLTVERASTVTDVTFLLVAGLFFLFSFVFQYGEELQRLSDETL